MSPSRRRRWSGLLGNQSVLFAVCCGLGLLTVGLSSLDGRIEMPFAVLAPLIVALVLLDNLRLAWFSGILIALVGAMALLTRPEWFVLLSFVFIVALCLVVLWFAARGEPIGATGRRGGSMLAELRDRILSQGEIPKLPKAWLVESALFSAGGSPFAGDFMVATTTAAGTRLEVAVVDVSGKGEAAGTRALQLSGAMGGLLGAMPTPYFLSAANDYLLRRSWEEGFATAIHLSLNLIEGTFEIRTAGHPPAAQRHAGSGRWQVLRTEGPVLGLIEGAEFEPLRGQLMPGDSLLLYTDGMVEEPRRDIDLGIDGMLGVAEGLLISTWEGMATRLTASYGSKDDDRALLVVHRR